MYKCLICGYERGNPKHTDKCSKEMQRTKEPHVPAPKVDWDSLPLRDISKRRTLNRFH